ncbi:VanW family protein [Peribacillus sp. FSL H8-0477]|uniref:VanW family protein n=1 Tax=Peribacillus sp. FSL H8-0477 TaxID=2921388 RepID=UPI0030F8AE28
MKKGILLLVVVGILVFSGVWLGVENTDLVFSKEKEPVKNSTLVKKELMLIDKKMSDPKLVLVDSRNGKEIQVVKASEIQEEQAANDLVRSLETKYDQPMIPARLSSDGTLKPGQARIVLEKKPLLEELKNLGAFQREVNVPIIESVPNVTAKTAANVDQTLLASYKTKFNSSVTGRTTNIALSASEIDQIILGPGDRFYYNLIVGERTEARGYQKAMEILNKELVEGIGGGICQTSSTLYNAVDQAGLEIIELNHHSKEVGYVPKDRDATVSYGGKDFKFLNNKDYPVLLKVIVNKTIGTIEVQVRAAQQNAG